MKEWENKIREEVTRAHRERVMQAASQFLKENSVRENAGFGKRYFLKGFLGGLAGLAAALVIVNRASFFKTNVVTETHELANSGILPNGNGVSSNLLVDAPLLQVDLDLLANLDMIEDLEVLEKWEPDKV